MLEKKDIEQAKKLFVEWDNNSKWKVPVQAFLEHTKIKAEGTLELAIYLLENSEKNELKNNETISLWIITQSYYSMFFLAEYLLGLDKKKLPEGTQDTHRTIYLAFLYYYLIKGSELERNSSSIPTTSRMSKALTLFKQVQDETLELNRIQRNVRNLNTQRDQRNNFTYRMNRTAEIKEARNSIKKATDFRNLIYEYLIARRR